MVGLGNPGDSYATTRHNVGQVVVESWAKDQGVKLSRLKAFGFSARVGVQPTIHVATTAGYMNVSGGPVQSMATYWGIPPERIVVVHDDLDLPFGTLRMKQGGGHGGHNGLKSIQAALGTPDFFRVRLGIGRPPGTMDPAAFVLRPFSKEESAQLPLIIERAKDATRALIDRGLTAAQATYHAPEF